MSAPTPFETFTAGMFVGAVDAANGREIRTYTGDELRGLFRDWLKERSADSTNGPSVSAPMYEVRCADGVRARYFPGLTDARRHLTAIDRPDSACTCGPHTLVSIDPDGTETDITDESEMTDA